MSMLRKLGRLFVIKNRFEAFLIIYALFAVYLNSPPVRRYFTRRQMFP